MIYPSEGSGIAGIDAHVRKTKDTILRRFFLISLNQLLHTKRPSSFPHARHVVKIDMRFMTGVCSLSVMPLDTVTTTPETEFFVFCFYHSHSLRRKSPRLLLRSNEKATRWVVP